MELADYQDVFSRALLAKDPLTDSSPALARLAEQPGFAIYRNTVLKGCIDALQANFPAVVRLVGEEWFRAAAAVYARQQLPTQATLLSYGAGFARFLASFKPAAELPYLPDVARIDRLWSESHVAADDDVLEPSALAHLSVFAMTRLSLRPHATARWAWFDEQTIYTLWVRNRGDATDHDAEIAWHGEGVLLTRPHGAVIGHPLTREGATFLSASAAGHSIEQAVGAALGVNAEADISALISQCLRAGAFGGLQISNVKDLPNESCLSLDRHPF